MEWLQIKTDTKMTYKEDMDFKKTFASMRLAFVYINI